MKNDCGMKCIIAVAYLLVVAVVLGLAFLSLSGGIIGGAAITTLTAIGFGPGVIEILCPGSVDKIEKGEVT